MFPKLPVNQLRRVLVRCMQVFFHADMTHAYHEDSLLPFVPPLIRPF